MSQRQLRECVSFVGSTCPKDNCVSVFPGGELPAGWNVQSQEWKTGINAGRITTNYHSPEGRCFWSTNGVMVHLGLSRWGCPASSRYNKPQTVAATHAEVSDTLGIGDSFFPRNKVKYVWNTPILYILIFKMKTNCLQADLTNI